MRLPFCAGSVLNVFQKVEVLVGKRPKLMGGCGEGILELRVK